jgi:FkbM family methyltransferase
MLRSLAAKSLSARQKSNIRKLAFSLGRYRRRPVEVLVDDLVTLDGAKSFLQIGANDGYMSDPLNLAIYRHRLSGTFVEPQPNYFRDLQNTYRGFADMRFLPYAISAEAGHMTMYTLDCESGALPGWARGVGTLSRVQIEKFGDQIDDIQSYIRSDHVECITVTDLLTRTLHPDPDMLVVDAEGFDHLILSQFDFAKLATRLVIYETESMEPGHAAELAATFEACGFGLIEAGQDTVAVRRTTATFRKHAARPN